MKKNVSFIMVALCTTSALFSSQNQKIANMADMFEQHKEYIPKSNKIAQRQHILNQRLALTEQGARVHKEMKSIVPMMHSELSGAEDIKKIKMRGLLANLSEHVQMGTDKSFKHSEINQSMMMDFLGSFKSLNKEEKLKVLDLLLSESFVS